MLDAYKIQMTCCCNRLHECVPISDGSKRNWTKNQNENYSKKTFSIFVFTHTRIDAHGHEKSENQLIFFSSFFHVFTYCLKSYFVDIIRAKISAFHSIFLIIITTIFFFEMCAPSHASSLFAYYTVDRRVNILAPKIFPI